MTIELCNKIINYLQPKPKTVYELAKEIFNDRSKSSNISPMMQKLKAFGIVKNLKDGKSVCYWGLEKSYRKCKLNGK